MIYRLSSLTALLLLFQQACVVISKQFSYIPTGYRYQDGVMSLSDALSKSNTNEPVIIFDFERPELLETIISSGTKYPFLSNFLNNDIAPIVSDDEDEAGKLEHDPRVEVFEVNEIPTSVSTILYDFTKTNKYIFLFKLQNPQYDIAALDKFLQSTCMFLQEILVEVENIIVNVHGLDVYEHKKQLKRNEEDDKKNGEKTRDDDKDVLSNIWTEGLLMCLLVSFFLLGILVIAIIWTWNIEISYGGLERSSNPIKKNK